MKRLSASLLLLLAGCGPTVHDAEWIARGRAVAAIELAAALAVEDAAPAPPPVDPADDVCPNCGGAGKLGDGRVFVECPECHGTGKRTTTAGDSSGATPRAATQSSAVVDFHLDEAAAYQSELPVLLVFTNPKNCPNCRKLEALLATDEARQALAGFGVVRIESGPRMQLRKLAGELPQLHVLTTDRRQELPCGVPKTLADLTQFRRFRGTLPGDREK